MIGMRRDINVNAALSKLAPNAQWAVRDEDYDQIEWYSEEVEQPSREQVEQMIAQLREEEPMNALREIRDWYLKESDWTQGADIRAIRGPEWCQAWDTYRQELRDLTKTQTPYFEDDSPIIMGITFPEKPQA
jgi:hypothetical protein